MTKVKKQIVERLYKGVTPGKDDIDFSVELIDDCWIKPIESFGPKFEEYQFSQLNDCGVHVLRFEFDEIEDAKHIDNIKGVGFRYLAKEIPATTHSGVQPGIVELKDILTRDDDNQPPATYTMYFGTLIVYIPYFA